MPKRTANDKNINFAKHRRVGAEAVCLDGVKGSSAGLYERKWAQFKAFSMDPMLQEGNGILDPDCCDEPSSDVISKIVEFFYYKVVEKNCDPGEVVNIRSALASTYKRKFGRIGEWKVLSDGTTEGSPVNSLLVTESMKSYQRKKKLWDIRGRYRSDTTTW